MTIIQALLIGALSGGLLTTGTIVLIDSKSKKIAQIASQQTQALEEIARINAAIQQGQIQIQKNLTAPDLLEVACSAEYLADNSDLLCREMFCRLQTREGDGASQQECESMANISNSLQILDACKDSGIDLETCQDIFEKRK